MSVWPRKMRNKLVSNASRKDCNPYILVCLRKDSCTSYCVASFNMGWQDISKVYTAYPC